MLSLKSRNVAFAAAVLGLAWSTQAFGSFHLMQVEQVIGGVNGDPTAQAIQLRQRFLGQNLMSFSRIRVHDANGANSVLVIDMTTNVANSAAGARILIVSPSFAANTTPAAVGDFTMTNVIPASYLAAGSLTFEDDGGTIYWRLSWGGAFYLGPNAGSITNDMDGNFGPPFPLPLPSDSNEAVRFTGAFGAASTNNAADYALTSGGAIFTNNSGSSFAVNAEEALLGDMNCDGTVTVTDIGGFVLALTDPTGYAAAFPTCDINNADINQDTSISVSDIGPFVSLLTM